NIGPYWDTVWVHNLIAGGSRAAVADRPWAASAGRWQCRMSAAVTCDLHPENNDTAFVFYVRGDIDHDVEVSSIDAPVVLVDTLPFVPLATVRNNCGSTEQFCTHFWIEDTWTETRVYYDTIPVTLAGGQHTALAFRPCTLRVEGPYVASCSAFLAVDQNWFNNTLHQGFRVRGGVGISDKPGQRLAAEVPEPTVVRGMLSLPAAGMTNGQEPMTLLDITGRKVADLKPGANDIRHLAPGIYYVHTTGDIVACRKLVKLE
ncbi:MAG: T9SS type A sorting domain-containing protein, partial [candidate division WOR-3 bacterium]